MVYLFYGPDSLRRGRKIKELTSAYLEKYIAPDMLEIDFEENKDAIFLARDFLNQSSLFVSTKLLLIRHGESALDDKEWAKVLKQELRTEKNFLFISSEEVPKKALSFLLEKPVISQEFPELSFRELAPFIEKERKLLGVVFEPAALSYFIEQISRISSGRSWRVLRELEKASCLNKKRTVSLNDIEAAFSMNEEQKVFESAKRIMWSRGLGEALRELELLLLGKQSGAYIFNSLGFQARGKELLQLAEYDVSIKSGKLEYEEALLNFLISRN